MVFHQFFEVITVLSTSREFSQFCNHYNIYHKTSSPHFQQSKGEAERLWKKASDKNLALLDYRSTPLTDIDLSPAQILMGRRLKNLLPSSSRVLEPTSTRRVSHSQVRSKLREDKKMAGKYYNKSSRDLQPLIATWSTR